MLGRAWKHRGGHRRVHTTTSDTASSRPTSTTNQRTTRTDTEQDTSGTCLRTPARLKSSQRRYLLQGPFLGTVPATSWVGRPCGRCPPVSSGAANLLRLQPLTPIGARPGHGFRAAGCAVTHPRAQSATWRVTGNGHEPGWQKRVGPNNASGRFPTNEPEETL